MKNSLAIVITGLPASGKSTVARKVAGALGFPCLDKDDFLEALYEINPVPDRETRTRLSRQSDLQFITAAKQATSAVLVSHWRNSSCGPESGTPTDWIISSFDTVVEVHCRCEVDLAVRRFQNRDRHPGHLDRDRSLSSIHASFSAYAKGLPIQLGNTIETSANIDGIVTPTIQSLRPFT